MRSWAKELLNACDGGLAPPVNISRLNRDFSPYTPVREPERTKHIVALKAAISAKRSDGGSNLAYNTVLGSSTSGYQIDGMFTNPRRAPKPVSSSSKIQQLTVSREDRTYHVSTVEEAPMHYHTYRPSGIESEQVDADTWKTFHPTLGTPGLAL